MLAFQHADRKAQPRAPNTQIGGLVHVAGDAPAQRADLRCQSKCAHFCDGQAVFLAAGYRAGLDLVDAEIIERACNRNLGGAIEYDASLLLAVAQRAVSKEDPAVRRDFRAGLLIERAGPLSILWTVWHCGPT